MKLGSSYFWPMRAFGVTKSRLSLEQTCGCGLLSQQDVGFDAIHLWCERWDRNCGREKLLGLFVGDSLMVG